MSSRTFTPVTSPTTAPGRTVRAAVRRHPLATFFVLAFALSWWLWPFVAAGATGDGFPAVASFGPFLAAVVVLALTTGRDGVRGLLRSMVRWRVPGRWWLAAVAAPVVLTALATLANVALGASVDGDALAGWSSIPVTLLAVLLVPGLGGAWEEPGWRGFALPRLAGDRGWAAAALLLGPVWAVWHLPLILTGQDPWSDLPLVTAASVVVGWVFVRGGGSVLLAMVFHATNNAVAGSFASQLFDGADATRQGWLLALVWVLAAAVLLLLVRAGRVTGRVSRSGSRSRAAS